MFAGAEEDQGKGKERRIWRPRKPQKLGTVQPDGMWISMILAASYTFLSMITIGLTCPITIAYKRE
jgi:hypothetical protein